MYRKEDLRPSRPQKARPETVAKSRPTDAGASRAAAGLPYVTPPREARDGLSELLGAGEFRSLVIKPDEDGGAIFTLKAVLVMPKGPVGVYMHGEVPAVEMLPSVLDDLLVKGQWRVDKYWRPAQP